jgi:hypothetical protein
LKKPEMLNIRVFFSFYLILTMLTPVDIIATMELVKVLYAQLIEADAWCMSGVPDGVGGVSVEGVKVQTLNLHEDLGEI